MSPSDEDVWVRAERILNALGEKRYIHRHNLNYRHERGAVFATFKMYHAGCPVMDGGVAVSLNYVTGLPLQFMATRTTEFGSSRPRFTESQMIAKAVDLHGGYPSAYQALLEYRFDPVTRKAILHYGVMSNYGRSLVHVSRADTGETTMSAGVMHKRNSTWPPPFALAGLVLVAGVGLLAAVHLIQVRRAV